MARLSTKAWLIAELCPSPRQSASVTKTLPAYKGRGELITTQLKFSINIVKLELWGWKGLESFPLCFHMDNLKGWKGHAA